MYVDTRNKRNLIDDICKENHISVEAKELLVFICIYLYNKNNNAGPIFDMIDYEFVCNQMNNLYGYKIPYIDAKINELKNAGIITQPYTYDKAILVNEKYNYLIQDKI